MPRWIPLLAAAPLALSIAGTAMAQRVRLAEPFETLQLRARQDSLDPAAHYNLALAYIGRNQLDAADSALDRAIAIDPSIAVAHLAKGVLREDDDRFWRRLRSAGNDSLLIRELRLRSSAARRAFLIDPYVDVRILGTVSRFDRRDEDALRFFLGTDFQRVVSLYRTGLQALVEGEYDRAYEALTQTLARTRDLFRPSRDSLPEQLLFVHTLAAVQTRRFAEATADVEELLSRSLSEEHKDTIRTSPLRTNEYRYMLAALKHRTGAITDAVRLYREVLEHDVGNYMAHVQLARIHEQAGDLEAAIRERQAAANVNHGDHTLLMDLGVTLIRAGRLAAAETVLVRARESNPRDSRVHYRVGLVQLQLGKRDEARQALETFLALAPSRYANPIADARQRLAQLR